MKSLENKDFSVEKKGDKRAWKANWQIQKRDMYPSELGQVEKMIHYLFTFSFTVLVDSIWHSNQVAI